MGDTLDVSPRVKAPHVLTASEWTCFVSHFTAIPSLRVLCDWTRPFALGLFLSHHGSWGFGGVVSPVVMVPSSSPDITKTNAAILGGLHAVHFVLS